MYAHWGQLQQAARDTMLAYAEGVALTKLGVKHGFMRPGAEISEAAYGDALVQAGYGARGTYLSMFDVIESALSDFRTVSTWKVDASEPASVYNAATTADDARYAERYIRIGDKVHYVQSVDLDVSVGPYTGATRLNIAQVDAIETSPIDVSGASNDDVTVVLLPFVVRVTQPGPLNEEATVWSPGIQCLYEVIVFDAGPNAVPPTYLLPDDPLFAAIDPFTPEGMPFGGQLVDDNEVGHQDQDGDDVGPHPVYLNDGGVFSLLQKQLQRLMCEGDELRMVHVLYS